MSQASVVHSTFVIERTFGASPSRVFAAFSDQATKRRWFAEGEDWHIDEFTIDFRVGGRELARFRFKDGPPVRNDTVYQDIVPDQRIVIAYSMTIGDKRISASLATFELVPTEKGTKLTHTEQGAYFDGADMPQAREEGCRGLLEALDLELQRS